MNEPVNLPGLFELAKKATPGPWHNQSKNFGYGLRDVCAKKHTDGGDYAAIAKTVCDEDGNLIVAARNALPAIKKMVRELKELEQKWRQNSERPSQDDYVKGMDFQSGSCADELRAILAEVGVKV